jgi:hypothetical protein
MLDREPGAGVVAPGEYAPAGELQGIGETFSADQVAAAFNVDVHRVHNAMAGEFRLGPNATVDSRQAQQLAEVMLTDQPLDIREAALMTLGAFTPRADQAWGVGETAPGEESDRFVADAHHPEDEVASSRSSHDASQPNE